MDTSCCSLSVSGLFQHSSNKGNRPCCKLPFNHDIALASFTGISCDKASFCRTHIITALPVTRTYRPSQTHKKILLQEPLVSGISSLLHEYDINLKCSHEMPEASNVGVWVYHL